MAVKLKNGSDCEVVLGTGRDDHVEGVGAWAGAGAGAGAGTRAEAGTGDVGALSDVYEGASHACVGMGGDGEGKAGRTNEGDSPSCSGWILMEKASGSVCCVYLDESVVGASTWKADMVVGVLTRYDEGSFRIHGELARGPLKGGEVSDVIAVGGRSIGEGEAEEDAGTAADGEDDSAP